MLKLFFNERNMRAVINGKDIQGNCVTLSGVGNYALQLLPSTTRVILQPVYTTLTLGVNDVLITALETIQISAKEYYLLPNFLPYVSASAPKIVSQNEYGEHRVTVYSDALTHACIENDTNYLDVILPAEPNEILTPSIDSGFLIIFCAERFLSVILYDYTDYYCILDKFCDSCEFTENGVVFRTEFNDNQGRVRYEEYAFKGNTYTLTSEWFEYKNPHKCAPDTIPVDFCQAVLNKDYLFAYTLIRDVDISMESLTEMFGADGQIVNIPSCANDGYVAILSTVNGAKRYLRFTFAVERDKIIDITVL